MLHKRCMLAVFLSFTMLSSMVPHSVPAASSDINNSQGDLHYSISETVSEDKTKSDITLEITETAGNTLNGITLPDGTVVSSKDSRQEADGSKKHVIRYTATKNGQIAFDIKYDSVVNMAETSKPEILPIKPEVMMPQSPGVPVIETSTSDALVGIDVGKSIDTVLLKTTGSSEGTVYEKAAAVEPKTVEKTITVPFRVQNLEKPKSVFKDNYVPGSATVEDVQIKQDGGDQSGIISSGDSMGLITVLQLSLKPDAESSTSVWVGYRFTLPKHTPSGGTWEFLSNTYNWLLDKNDPSVVAKPVDDGLGNWILEGVVLLQDGGNTVIPGSSTRAITVTNKGGVEGETANLTGKVWLVSDGEDSGFETSKKITVSSNPEFDLRKHYSEPLFSAYVNTATGAVSLTEPEAGGGYVFGRIYGVSSIVWSNLAGGEKLDPTKPITWDMSYKVFKKEGSTAEAEENDPDLKPILLGVRRNGGKEFTENKLYSEMSGTPLGDMAMGGNVKSLFLDHNGLYNTPFYKGGTYTFTGGNGTVRTEVLLSADDKNTGYNAAENVAIFFVPLNLNDNENTTRKLVVNLSNLSATSYSGKNVVDANVDGQNTSTFEVPRKAAGTGAGLFSRQIVDVNGKKTIKIGKQSRLQATLITSEPGTLVDYNINAINMLVKVETGFDLLGNTVPSVNGYTGTNTVLWATKPDGSDWSDEKELNHTEDWQLRYFDNFEDAKNHGRVVGILLELRDGIWSSENELSLRTGYQAAGTTGTAYAAVQDIRIWRGNRKLSAADSYKGTNGAKVEKFAVDSTDLMVPYDNPYNDSAAVDSEKVYRKDKWNSATGTAEPIEDITWGYTIFSMGGEIDVNKSLTQTLNGSAIGSIHGAWNQEWGISTYDTANGERYADRTYGFTVDGVGEKPLDLKAVLDTKNYMSKEDKVKQIGAVYLSTKENPVVYTPGSSPGMRGSFSGGKIIDINHFTVPGDGNYQLYYTSFIGDDASLDNDVRVGVYWNESRVDAIGDSNKLVTTRDAVAATATNVTKSTITGTRKSTLNPAATDEVAYRLTLHATAQALNNIYMLDVLPFNGDGRGTNFHGSYTLKDNKIPLQLSAVTGAPLSNMPVYYTTDTNIRTAGENGSYAKSDIFNGKNFEQLGDSFIAGGSTFTLAKKNTDNTWSVKDGDVPTAILVCGTLMRNEQLSVTLQMKTKDSKRGDVYINTASTAADEYKKPIDSNVTTVTVASRKISGKAWQDNDKNGLYSGADTLLANVGVKLYQADGTLIEKDANGSPYGVVKTSADGSFNFNNVPEFAAGYYITYSGDIDFNISEYEVTQKYAGGAVLPQTSEIDSDTEAFAGLPLVSVKTDVFTMLSDTELVNAAMPIQHYKGIDAGFIKIPDPPKYTLTYHANGGIGNMVDSSSPYLEGDTISVMKNTFTREGYTFSHWNTAADNTGISYGNGSRASSRSAALPIDFIMPAENVTLFAQWKKDEIPPVPHPTYTVSYHENGGSGTMTDPKSPYLEGTDITVLHNTFTRSGYTFTGWNTAADNTGTAYNNGAVFSMPSENVTLFAQWKKDEIPPVPHPTYTVTYHANGGSGTMTDPKSPYLEGTDVTVLHNTFTRSGYTFTGWNTAADNTGTAYNNGAVFSMPSENVTLFAQWSKDNTGAGDSDSEDSTLPSVPTPSNPPVQPGMPTTPIPPVLNSELDSVPKTADSTNSTLWLVLMGLSLTSLVLILLLGRKNAVAFPTNSKQVTIVDK